MNFEKTRGLCLILICAAGAMLFAASRFPETRQESLSLTQAHNFNQWMFLLYKSPAEAFDEASLEKYWNEDNLHPSLPKMAMGVIILILGNWCSHLFLARSISVLSLLGTLWIIYCLTRREWGTMKALAAAVTPLLLPRILGHSLIASVYIPFTFLWFLSIYALYRSEESKTWRILLPLMVAGMCGAKVTGLLFIPVMLIFTAIRIFLNKKGSLAQWGKRILIWLILIPLIFLMLWPWLWPDPWGKMVEHINASHDAVPGHTVLGGRMFEVVPIYYPIVYIVVTTPLLLLFGLVGTLRGRAGRPGAAEILLLLTFGGFIMIFAMPIHNAVHGVRYFLPALFALAAFSGYGFMSLIELFGNRFFPRTPHHRFHNSGIIILLLYAGIQFFILFPTFLSDYNCTIGNLGKARQKGWEVEYWGIQ